jgi:hypothetical protein
MLTLAHHTTDGHQCQFSSLHAVLAEPFPQTPEDMLQLEQRRSVATAQLADQSVLVQVTRAHATSRAAAWHQDMAGPCPTWATSAS